MTFEIAKAGWLMRESSFLKRWRKNWFVLYQDGLLKYFDSENSSSAEEVVIMKAHCEKILDGLMVTDVTPPAGYGKGCLLRIQFTDKTWTVCADSPDDMSAWKFALEEARNIPTQRATGQRSTTASVVNYPPAYQYPPQAGTSVTTTTYPRQTGPYPGQTVTYPGQTVVYPGQVLAGPQTQTYVVQAGQPLPPATTQTIIYTEPYTRYGRHRCYRRGGYRGYGYYDDSLWWW